MKFSKIKGVCLFEYFRSADSRGCFEKPVAELTIQFPQFRGLREHFLSSSGKFIWRGFHLQTGKYASNRIIYCAAGAADDFLLDLRSDSETFLSVQHTCLEHSGTAYGLFVPAGVAHGFLSRVDNTIIAYLSDRSYAPDYDHGVRLDSVLSLADLGLETAPCSSERDLALPSLDEFLNSIH